MWKKIKELILNFIKKRYTKEQIARLFFAVTIFIFICLIFGCSNKAEAKYYPIYKNVNIPVNCNVTMPEKPKYTGDTVKDNLNILQYAESLKATLLSCIK